LPRDRADRTAKAIFKLPPKAATNLRPISTGFLLHPSTHFIILVMLEGTLTRGRPIVLTLEHLRNPLDAELSRFDLAAIDLACAVGLPGSERLDIPACLAWVDHAAAWVRHQTATTIDQSPKAFSASWR